LPRHSSNQKTQASTTNKGERRRALEGATIGDRDDAFQARQCLKWLPTSLSSIL